MLAVAVFVCVASELVLFGTAVLHHNEIKVGNDGCYARAVNELMTAVVICFLLDSNRPECGVRKTLTGREQ